MANSLYNSMSIQNQNNPLEQLAQQARQLKQTFTGNPREEVQKLLNSGAMSQQDFNRYSQIAQQVMQIMGKN